MTKELKLEINRLKKQIIHLNNAILNYQMKELDAEEAILNAPTIEVPENATITEDQLHEAIHAESN